MRNIAIVVLSCYSLSLMACGGASASSLSHKSNQKANSAVVQGIITPQQGTRIKGQQSGNQLYYQYLNPTPSYAMPQLYVPGVGVGDATSNSMYSYRRLDASYDTRRLRGKKQ